MRWSPNKIDKFRILPGRIIGGKYVVDAKLGGGWEGEVYRVQETRTGVTRAAKLFYPKRNIRDRAVRFYAKKLDRLRKCPIVIQYHHSETIRYRGVPISCLISGRRLWPFDLMPKPRAKKSSSISARSGLRYSTSTWGMTRTSKAATRKYGASSRSSCDTSC